jgi:hypothetical protein
VTSLLLQRAGLFGGAVNWSGTVTWVTSVPVLVFELALAVWLIVKGVWSPVGVQAAPREAALDNS